MPTPSNDLGDSPLLQGEVPQRRTAPPPAPVAQTTRSFRPATMQRCPNCGASNHTHASICTTCGENLQVKPQKIRCRRCGKRASTILVVCPHCGRELQPAPARWLVWGAPVALVALFLVTMLGRGQAINPVDWVQTQVKAGVNWVQQLGERMDPTLTIQDPTTKVESQAPAIASNNSASPPTVAPVAIEPVGAQAVALITQTATISVTATLAPVPTATQVATLPPTATVEPTASSTATPLPTATTTNTSVATNTATPLATPTHTTVVLPTATTTVLTGQTVSLTVTLMATPIKLVATPDVNAADSQASNAVTTTQKVATKPILLPTNTPATTSTATNTAAASPTATLEPSPTATSTPVPPRTYTIKTGDTLSEIADQFNVTTDALMAANNLAPTDIYSLQLGQELIIPGQESPAATPVTEETQTPTPTNTVTTRTYTLQAGDTPLKIATQFGISVDELLAANNLNREDARRLRSGQVLVIPGVAGEKSTVAPTEAVVDTPAAPAAAQSAIRLDTPQLRSPEDNTQISCNGGDKLIWQPINFMRASDFFILHLGFVNGVGADGKENVVWVLEQRQSAGNTLWSLDAGLCSLAPQQYGRKWYWYVEVAEESAGKTTPVSPPSPLWSFRWN